MYPDVLTLLSQKGDIFQVVDPVSHMADKTVHTPLFRI